MNQHGKMLYIVGYHLISLVGCNFIAEHTGRPYLGVAIGSREFIEEYVRSQIKIWSANVAHLSKVAKTQPHAAVTASI